MTIPKTMKAAILAELQKPLVVDQVELPPALEVGQVLVKVECSGICGSQLGEIDGAKGEDKYLPHLLGHEGSGVVEAVGPGVRFVKPGDRVVLHWRKSQGIDSVPPKYTWRGNTLNAGLIATFNEYAIVSENRVTRIDADSDMEVASLFGCAVTTGFGVAENNAKIKFGESVVVFGAGGVGLNIIQAAGLLSAYPIIAVDLYDGRLDLAKSLGATHTINAKDVDAKAALLELLGPQSLDVFIDNTGQPSIIEMGYELTKAQGRVVLVGVPRKGRNISIFSLPLHFDKRISGSHGGEAVPHLDIPRYTKLLDAGLIQLKPLITEYFKLDDINTAIQRMRSGELSGRCLIKM
ncbi:Zn-dependent alcohol dehydrogenase [Herbaspirillum sp. Sphag1AN]|uniref:zinc-binding dehydrogenase n=1 Tax=unclassified Herbaspirillum TaxID=2624150 RepID=UPI00160DD674|nr:MULTISPECIES: zinc-binding dehydrogenase [unclassified Herbaspirillum]MBB3212996.1 Zn-dependent alcohol dehydrogenase [Herbaspirillum sp. Sphag1AN]MBB3246193.1 Zn-dependent alcohol dehydrogenase [Herbaspirillum sp. Sphag64]